MKKLPTKYITVLIIVILLTLTLYISHSFITKQLQELQLNNEFVCPENQTPKQADAYRIKQTTFYLNNYPNITFSDFLSRRMQLLTANNCTTTLQNLAKENNGASPNQNSVNELEKIPYGETNRTLRELK